MKNIKSIYTNYADNWDNEDIEKISKRYQFLYQEMSDFIKRIDAEDKLQINGRSLMHTVMEYFEDIAKLKSAHNLKHANEPKVIAYTAYWLLRRKPIQLLIEDDDDLVFANEKFVLSFMIQFMTKGRETVPLADDDLDLYRGFLNTLYYYLKYRKLDAQSLELILMSFKAGTLFS